jgi:hypothetical protein
MSSNRPENAVQSPPAVATDHINHVLSGIRVPNLPYPVGKVDADKHTDWRPLLLSCWTEQRDERVTKVLDSVQLVWTVRQVNAAYIADRLMDVFLKTSGLHPVLASRIARLRFLVAWQLDLHGGKVFNSRLGHWLDSLQDLRGWSDSGGRSARWLLDQLDGMVVSVSACFEKGDMKPFETFCEQWEKDAERRNQQVHKLADRLLATEQGAARQKRAEQTVRALVGRAFNNRQLPPAIIRFVTDHWMPMLKQVVWKQGTDSDPWKHGSKMLEWLVWIGDPALSDKDRNRLYHVGEQLADKLAAVWKSAMDTSLPAEAFSGIEQVMVSRLRGETPEREPALPGAGNFEFDTTWLDLQCPSEEQVAPVANHWYVEGEGHQEQRRYFFALLEDTCEVLWTNGSGVKLGTMGWQEFRSALESGRLRSLPDLNPFGQVLSDTIQSLVKVWQRQKQQRDEAAREAREKAEALRRKKEAEEQRRREEEEARKAEEERVRREAEEQRLAEEEAERQRLAMEREDQARKLVDAIKLGGWISVEPDEDYPEARRLKLAVRINASRKLVFVDRLGLNRTEYLTDDLVADVVAGRVRVLDGSAEFDDALTRVVGRIRVGR